MMRSSALSRVVRGIYCVVVAMRGPKRIMVGSLGNIEFPAGVYVYVGSGMAGVEHRIERHGRKAKRKRWHIDYLMEGAELVASVAIPCGSKEVECAAALALRNDPGAVNAVTGFGCSDCSCDSHLVYFGDVEDEWVAETVSLRLSMLQCVYPGGESGGVWGSREGQ